MCFVPLKVADESEEKDGGAAGKIWARIINSLEEKMRTGEEKTWMGGRRGKEGNAFWHRGVN